MLDVTAEIGNERKNNKKIRKRTKEMEQQRERERESKPRTCTVEGIQEPKQLKYFFPFSKISVCKPTSLSLTSN